MLVEKVLEPLVKPLVGLKVVVCSGDDDSWVHEEHPAIGIPSDGVVIFGIVSARASAPLLER